MYVSCKLDLQQYKCTILFIFVNLNVLIIVYTDFKEFLGLTQYHGWYMYSYITYNYFENYMNEP